MDNILKNIIMEGQYDFIDIKDKVNELVKES